MLQAEDFRRRAEDFAKRASEAQDEYHRENFQMLADMWADMAEKTERRAGSKANTISAEDRKSLAEALATIRKAESL